MDYFYSITPSPASIPPGGKGFLQGLSESVGPRLDAYGAAKTDENQWRNTVQAFPESPNGFSRAQMFALGRNPELRAVAVEMLTGRMRPEQLMAPAQPPEGAQRFAPSRMATDADYEAMHG